MQTCGREADGAVLRQALVFDITAQFDGGVGENAVADLKVRDGAAHRFHVTRQLTSEDRLSWLRESEHQWRDRPEAARHVFGARPPVTRCYSRRVHLDENFIVLRRRFRDVRNVENVGRSKTFVCDRLHLALQPAEFPDAFSTVEAAGLKRDQKYKATCR